MALKGLKWEQLHDFWGGSFSIGFCVGVAAVDVVDVRGARGCGFIVVRCGSVFTRGVSPLSLGVGADPSCPTDGAASFRVWLN